MVKKVRFTEPKDTRMDELDGGDNISFTCRGWYRHGCEKLMLRFAELPTMFPGRTYITAMDVIEYVMYVDPRVCSILEMALRELIRSLETVEAGILEGKWEKGVVISTVTSGVIRRMLGSIHIIDEMHKLAHYMMDTIYRSYIAKNNPDAFLPAPTAPIMSLPNVSSPVKNGKGVLAVVNAALPYAIVLENYHIQIANLALRTSEALEQSFKQPALGF